MKQQETDRYIHLGTAATPAPFQHYVVKCQNGLLDRLLLVETIDRLRLILSTVDRCAVINKHGVSYTDIVVCRVRVLKLSRCGRREPAGALVLRPARGVRQRRRQGAAPRRHRRRAGRRGVRRAQLAPTRAAGPGAQVAAAPGPAASRYELS